MKPHELLRQCADVLERHPDNKPMSEWHALALVWPNGRGRFPFLGKSTELLNATEGQKVYRVHISTVLRALAKIV